MMASLVCALNADVLVYIYTSCEANNAKQVIQS